ncbi:hypothetical protein DPMN_182726 [Dreissena polymorpha]|uniref:Uncharacterized protein n=1 Tax=Dreissena polymorpha TaxID=45954 RepID=A0A9D4DG88_DREPO|nr:hypothetical protein DPMN_182726 [Dreissena polymorpha]
MHNRVLGPMITFTTSIKGISGADYDLDIKSTYMDVERRVGFKRRMFVPIYIKLSSCTMM